MGGKLDVKFEDEPEVPEAEPPKPKSRRGSARREPKPKKGQKFPWELPDTIVSAKPGGVMPTPPPLRHRRRDDEGS